MTRTLAIFRIALRDSLPILIGYGTMGFAAGVVFAMVSTLDAPAIWSGATSILCISGTQHFALPSWIRDDKSLTFIAVATLMISFRYAFYGFSMVNRWRDVKPWKKAFLILSLTDETFALESSRMKLGKRLHLYRPPQLSHARSILPTYQYLFACKKQQRACP